MEERKDYKSLIDAVERYVNVEEYPKVEVIMAILDIEKREDHGTPAEL